MFVLPIRSILVMSRSWDVPVDISIAYKRVLVFATAFYGSKGILLTMVEKFGSRRVGCLRQTVLLNFDFLFRHLEISLCCPLFEAAQRCFERAFLR
jgi:hypothetical protein